MAKFLRTLAVTCLAAAALPAHSTGFHVSEWTYPGASATQPFTAYEPYQILIMGQLTNMTLYGNPRTFDFSGTTPFVNTLTNVANAQTFQYWDPTLQQAVTMGNITNAGAPGRVDQINGYTRVRYVANDGIVAGHPRAQLNSYNIPPRMHVRWDLIVSFGADDGQNNWTLLAPWVDQILFWQVKSTYQTPPLTAYVDTDPNDPANSLRLSFGRTTGGTGPAGNLYPTCPNYINIYASIGGIPRYTEIPISIEAFLDERPNNMGGQGYVQVTVNGKVIGGQSGPNLAYGFDPHWWALDQYLWQHAGPWPYTRAIYYKKAQFFVFPYAT